jgi:aminopeptidase N
MTKSLSMLLSRKSSDTTSNSRALSYPWLQLARGGQQQSLFSSSTGHSTTATALGAASTTATTETPVEEDTTTAITPKFVEVFRSDYRPLPFHVDTVEMEFDLDPQHTTVTTTMTLKRNPLADITTDSDAAPAPMVLDGDETSVTLKSLTLNGVELKDDEDYMRTPGHLTLTHPLRDGDVLKTVVTIVPQDNTQLSGLYKSGSMLCTQCEAMGFRRITYYPDRPDNMASFTKVTLRADQEHFPVLLSNGDCIETGVLPSTKEDDASSKGVRHYSVWRDPFPKPSYLFAVVAGDLGKITDTFTTRSGQTVQLQIFSEPDNTSQLQFAMESLKKSMQWDEDRFNLEYDLGMYNIVATNDFNMGAMENKGLNIFNTAYVLADEKTATDTDFERVEGVIGHEVCTICLMYCVGTIVRFYNEMLLFLLTFLFCCAITHIIIVVIIVIKLTLETHMASTS